MNESTNPKDKVGRLKPRLHLIPPVADIEESIAMGLGADRYGAYNWRDTKVRVTVYLDAAKRHLLAYLDGEDIDPESGVSHIAHVRANMGIILDATAQEQLIDDRPTGGKAAQRIKDLTQKMEPIVPPAKVKPCQCDIWQTCDQCRREPVDLSKKHEIVEEHRWADDGGPVPHERHEQQEWKNLFADAFPSTDYPDEDKK